MEIKEATCGALTILGPVDRLDSTTSPIFERALEAKLKEEENRHFVLDLAAVDFVSSAGLRVLIMLSRRLAAAEGSLVLCNLDRRVREVFEVAGLTAVFSIAESRAAAIGQAGSAAIDGIASVAAALLGAETPTSLAPPQDAGGPDAQRLSATVHRLLSFETDETRLASD